MKNNKKCLMVPKAFSLAFCDPTLKMSSQNKIIRPISYFLKVFILNISIQEWNFLASE